MEEQRWHLEELRHYGVCDEGGDLIARCEELSDALQIIKSHNRVASQRKWRGLGERLTPEAAEALKELKDEPEVSGKPASAELREAIARAICAARFGSNSKMAPFKQAYVERYWHENIIEADAALIAIAAKGLKLVEDKSG